MEKNVNIEYRKISEYERGTLISFLQMRIHLMKDVEPAGEMTGRNLMISFMIILK